jgi:DnaJ family protein B protein 4
MSAKSKTYYEILDIPKTASETEIKKAYRSMSLKYHPDRNPSEDATTIFQSINEAYETLIDPVKRKQYDMGGGGFPFSMESGDMGDEMTDLNNIFNMMFSGMGAPGFAGPNIHVFHGPGGGIHINGQSRGPMSPFGNVFSNMQKPVPIIKSIRITIEQAYLGGSIPIEVERWVLQNDIKHFEIETIYIPIHKGIDENEFIILREKGNVINEHLKGDIKITIQIDNTSGFKRHGLDLIYTKTLTLKEALCGFTMEINHLSGKKLNLSNITNRSIISPNSKKVLNEFGMIRDTVCGNLIIEFIVQFPEKITDEQHRALSETL